MKFTVLPNLIALAVLVAIFWAISRKATTERVHLWFAGWAFILLHFAAEFVSAAKDPWGAIAAIVSVDSLVLGGVAFLISVSGIAARRQQLTLALSIAGPALAYATGVVCGITSKNYYFALIAASVLAPSICCRAQAVQSKWKALGISAVAGSAAVIAVWAIVRGNPAWGDRAAVCRGDFLYRRRAVLSVGAAAVQSCHLAPVCHRGKRLPFSGGILLHIAGGAIMAALPTDAIGDFL